MVGGQDENMLAQRRLHTHACQMDAQGERGMAVHQSGS